MEISDRDRFILKHAKVIKRQLKNGYTDIFKLWIVISNALGYGYKAIPYTKDDYSFYERDKLLQITREYESKGYIRVGYHGTKYKLLVDDNGNAIK